jgi:hypothetical protein
MKEGILSKLLYPKEINFKDAKRIFWEQNKMRSHNSKWPFHLINNANAQCGKWIFAKIPYEVFCNIKLPYHYHGKKVLVPKKGLTLKQTFERLKKINKRYRKTNPICSSKINYFSKKDIGTIFLSAMMPKGRDGYGKNKVKKSLIHIDGLHRLLGEMYKLERKKYKPIKAIIAIKKD